MMKMKNSTPVVFWETAARLATAFAERCQVEAGFSAETYLVDPPTRGEIDDELEYYRAWFEGAAAALGCAALELYREAKP